MCPEIVERHTILCTSPYSAFTNCSANGSWSILSTRPLLKVLLVVDDPSAYVDVLRADAKLRRKAETVLRRARAEIWRSWRRACEERSEWRGVRNGAWTAEEIARDAVPSEVVDRWKRELGLDGNVAADDPRAADLRERLAKYEDAGHGECWLARDDIGKLVEDALLHFDSARYRLVAWCVMPNHVHVIIETMDGYPLGEVLHSWKSFTAKEANKLLGRTGEFWMPDYYDRYIRDERHLAAAVAYVEPILGARALGARASGPQEYEDAAGTAALPGIASTGWETFLDAVIRAGRPGAGGHRPGHGGLHALRQGA